MLESLHRFFISRFQWPTVRKGKNATEMSINCTALSKKVRGLQSLQSGQLYQLAASFPLNDLLLADDRASDFTPTYQFPYIYHDLSKPSTDEFYHRVRPHFLLDTRVIVGYIDWIRSGSPGRALPLYNLLLPLSLEKTTIINLLLKRRIYSAESIGLRYPV